jgi:plasmid stabilization system protein ParE
MAKALSPEWTNEAISDLKSIYNYLLEWNSERISLKIVNEILNAPNGIIFGDQFQIDDFFPDYRRIVIRNYKVLYYFNTESIIIVGVFNTHRDPSKMRR